MRNLNKLPKKIFNNILPIGLMLIGVSSCTVSKTATNNNDGIYFDPSTDVQEVERVKPIANSDVVVVETQNPKYQETARIGGKYFDNQGNALEQTYDDYETNQQVYNDSNDVEWGDESNTQVSINNFYGNGLFNPYFNSFYGNPYFGSGISFNFGWNSFYRDPFFPGFGFYDPFYNPFFGNRFYGYYNPYNPYFGFRHHPFYPNRFFRNYRLTPVNRGRGNYNGVSNNRYNSNRNNGVAVRRPASRNTRIRRNSSIKSNQSTNGVRRRSSVNKNTRIQNRRTSKSSINKKSSVRRSAPSVRSNRTYRSSGSVNRSSTPSRRPSSTSRRR